MQIKTLITKMFWTFGLLNQFSCIEYKEITPTDFSVGVISLFSAYQIFALSDSRGRLSLQFLSKTVRNGEGRFNLYTVGDDGLLRFGHAAALTAHRAVIHYRAAASLPRRPVSFSICRSLREVIASPTNVTATDGWAG